MRAAAYTALFLRARTAAGPWIPAGALRRSTMEISRRKMMTARFFVYLFICFCGRLVAAESAAVSSGVLTSNIDPAKSAVHFTLGAVLHTVHGTFRIKNGTLRFDPGSGKMSGQIAVDVRSGNTGEATRDRQMHANVLESDRFPDAVFLPDRVNGRVASSGEFEVEVHGAMRVHGGDHEMTIPVRVRIQDGLVTARAKFAVPYVAWGMKDPSNVLLRVDKSVNVEVTLEGNVVR
jgi:polyisoprenoid-binding protein YceI